MKRARTLCHVALAASVLFLPTAPSAFAQAADIISFAQARIAVVPRHHHHIYFTFNINGCNPTQGYYILFQVNQTGTDCPETLCIAPWLNCGGGGVSTGRAGVASGSIVSRQRGGWWIYEFSFQVQNAFTQIFDAARQTKAASGYSRLLCSVYYERSQPLDPRDPNYSVLGPIAHAGDYPGVVVRNFRFNIQAQGSGTSHLFARQTAGWQLSNAFLQQAGLAVGDFQLTPR
jgi:hypothetical protein